MGIDRAYGFTAPPEVVFGNLTDPAHLDRWLPPGVHGEPAGSGEVRLRAGGVQVRCVVATTPEDMRLQWHLADRDDVRGTVQALDGPAGGAQLRVRVSAPDAALPAGRAEQLLADAVERLQRDVEDNLTAG
ncbi:SRPBCC domain-containing protein [Dactylosporangium sp. NPDC051541]|uniref:SRPBCC domain-containing protein n=1 Tax=Dactylosporangium sp. NPDC051541 TaxID=3363977 RepID=UPI003798FE18